MGSGTGIYSLKSLANSKFLGSECKNEKMWLTIETTNGYNKRDIVLWFLLSERIEDGLGKTRYKKSFIMEGGVSESGRKIYVQIY